MNTIKQHTIQGILTGTSHTKKGMTELKHFDEDTQNLMNRFGSITEKFLPAIFYRGYTRACEKVTHLTQFFTWLYPATATGINAYLGQHVDKDSFWSTTFIYCDQKRMLEKNNKYKMYVNVETWIHGCIEAILIVSQFTILIYSTISKWYLWCLGPLHIENGCDWQPELVLGGAASWHGNREVIPYLIKWNCRLWFELGFGLQSIIWTGKMCNYAIK